MSFRLGLGLGVMPASARPSGDAPPVNVDLPSISGILTQGQTLTADPGSWSGTPSGVYGYQWQRWDGDSWENIVGATASTRVATSDDVAAGADALRVAVTATNDSGPATAYSDPVTIAAPLEITHNPPDGTVGTPYTSTPIITGGHPPYSVPLTGTLNAGLSNDTSTGTISGTPLSAGTAGSLSQTVTDADGLTDSTGTFDIAVSSAPVAPVISTSSSQSVNENSAFSVTLTANESVTWSKVGGADAAQFTLVGADLGLGAQDYDGTPDDADANNTYVVTVRATSVGSGLTTDKTITVTINNVSEGGGVPGISTAPVLTMPLNLMDPAVITPGTYTNTPTSYSRQIQRWNGSSWANVGSTFSGTTYALDYTADIAVDLRVVEVASNGTGPSSDNPSSAAQMPGPISAAQVGLPVRPSLVTNQFQAT